MPLRFVLLACCTGALLSGFGQDLSGTWEGEVLGLNNRPGRGKASFTLQLDARRDSLVTGTTFSGDLRGRHKYYAVSGAYHRQDSTLFLKQDTAISIDRGGGTDNTGFYRLKLRVEHGTTLVLSGKWRPNNGGFGTSRVVLRKATPAAARPDAAPDKNLERAQQLLATVAIPAAEADSITIELFDNNKVDNDIVSVYLNNRPLLKHCTLTAVPRSFTVSLNRNEPACRVTLAAESLGMEPPCTASMIVWTKTQRVQVAVSGTFTTNPCVDLLLKE